MGYFSRHLPGALRIMIYEKPIFRTMADTALNIEFGDETSIPMNFKILALDSAIAADRPKGLLETNPQVRSLGIVYNPLVTARTRLISALCDLIDSLGKTGKGPSRTVIIPALYNDPWSRECAAAFGVRDNMEYIAEFNHMKPAQVIEKIVEGKLEKHFATICLVDQAFVKQGDLAVKDHIATTAKALDDTITVDAFLRYQVGETQE